ncbi:MAG: DUF3431 domain-containing protein [Verrucomicrobia bacterium]|nr:DUF3431 domain-containing protein [Verrucomicrobiota bacterium]NBU68824.1 DUF3431 domain-containing protein [Verrucomicrobiota bacterium]NDB99875.1 DUF3431 domain-containing protein [Verrucomicrobiota bacterium]NDF16596.1 DUF3431 domain-containing protein [Verrucomicrobiota bacterium]
MKRPVPPADLELVVCRCGEEMGWLRNVPRGLRVTVYEKTPGPAAAWPGSIPLPNVGREAHAWLHHLAERYDSLAEWTLFAQGHPFDHVPDMHGVIRRLAGHPPAGEDFLWLGFLWETDDSRGHPSFVHWTKNPLRRELDLAGFFRSLWNEPVPDRVRYVGGGQFAVSRKAAHRRTRDFYERALLLASEFPDAAHAFERTWDRVFLAPPLDPRLFGPSGMRLLKPVRKKAAEESSGRRGGGSGTPLQG